MFVFARAETGFNHVGEEKYEPRLLHFKGKRVRKMLCTPFAGLSAEYIPAEPAYLSIYVENYNNVRTKTKQKSMGSSGKFQCPLSLPYETLLLTYSSHIGLVSLTPAVFDAVLP